MSYPPALLVAGTDEHRRRVFLRGFTHRLRQDGYLLQPLDGSDREGLLQVLSSAGVLFSSPTAVIITHPEKVSPKDVEEHLQTPTPELLLLLVSESDKPSGGILDGFPSAHTKLFPLPPFYKLDDHAVDYALELARTHGVGLPEPLARALVRKVGNDLGVIFFEMEKLSHLVKSRGERTITPAHVKASMAPLVELDGSTLVEVLGTRSRRPLAEELARYRASKKSDPTIEVCGKVLTPTVLRWLQASHLHAKGIAPASAAGRVGSSPWFWEHKVLPVARNWGTEGCRELLSAISKAQESVFSGGLSPWRILESGLLRLTK